MVELSDIQVVYLADHPTYEEEVGHLKYEQWLDTSPDRPYDAWIGEIRDSARKDNPPLTLITIRGAELLGFVTLIELDTRNGIENGLWMITLYVKAPYRRHGIGAMLAERCAAEGLRLGYDTLHLWTESPQLTAYYAHHGWRLVGQDEDGDDVMMRELRPC
jgi:GNAT superfamily N-acetyltransferase